MHKIRRINGSHREPGLFPHAPPRLLIRSMLMYLVQRQEQSPPLFGLDLLRNPSRIKGRNWVNPLPLDTFVREAAGKVMGTHTHTTEGGFLWGYIEVATKVEGPCHLRKYLGDRQVGDNHRCRVQQRL